MRFVGHGVINFGDMVFKNKIQGFTLIELLIVIAIIGILAGMVLVATSSSRNRGRDARRASDLRAIQSAQELLFGDDDHYTQSAIDVAGNLPAAVNGAGHQYLKETVDPLNNDDYKYIWLKNDIDCGGLPAGKYYCALAKMEEKKNCAPDFRYFVVKNGGAKEICENDDYVAGAPPSCADCLAF